MPIDPKEALEAIGIPDPEKVKDMDEFRGILSQNYLHKDTLDDPTSKEYKKHIPKIVGRVTGKTETAIKSFLKDNGFELPGEEIKGKDIDEIAVIGLNKVFGGLSSKVKELETSSTATKDEAVKAWEDKYTNEHKKRTEAEKLAAETGTKLQETENRFQGEIKNFKVNELKKTKLSQIKWKAGISENEKKGILSTINDELKFESNEDLSDLDALNTKGERISHKKVHGKFMTADEAIEDIVKREKGWAENPHIPNKSNIFDPSKYQNKNIQSNGNGTPEPVVKKTGARVSVSGGRKG